MRNKHRKEYVMEKQTFTISNISCGHCVATIQKELKELDGVTNVGGEPQDKTITVDWKAPTTVLQIEKRLTEIGYPVFVQN
jgi:copper chaperone